ncbi:pyruvate carboxylase [Aminipila luticellarii]|uniref:Pyruvate carboxylase n=1 Tax=Aminipila luticellarii TaxID=2507160 RepID=A0A410PUG2_9FIRM|nr:pyruvate carboxylase [Aminipila luticellarii]QAT42569.1 pyruvate carboxylase [Aminipila luticellarii]
MQQKFKRVLVANRGEIAIRVFRACKELGIRTVAIYSEEDRNSLFRTKADEAYQIGRGKSPVDVYLSINEIIELAKAKGVDAIHPGYGFLSENVEFARKCEEEGIVFIGPTYQMMDRLGDKIKSKIVAHEVGVPTIPGVEKAIENEEEAKKIAEACGYPIMLKAAAGGGGRGMRIVRKAEDLLAEFRSARSEAKKAFGIDDIFIEKYLESPKHIEVQVFGDNYGNIVHLHERDCSIQRRHQKVIEFTPAICITQEQRENICADALKMAKAVSYRSAGTVEFLVDKTGQHYFIEMNPRIQVEHTVTEMVTGIDIVQSQILAAEGYPLDSDRINIKSQKDIQPRGYAIQCRVTTEDPSNGFAPDTGVIDLYRTGSGFGIRLDGGNGFSGATITPYYDSLLVKVTACGRTFDDTIAKALRALDEAKIKGVKTNIGFIMNVLNHEMFRAGKCDTGFIADNPALFEIKSDDPELKILNFLGNKFVNETKGEKPQFDVPVFPRIKSEVIKELRGTKQRLDEEGPEKLSKWIGAKKELLLTDTTMRDAQQSLMATRVRTIDMEKIAPATALYGQNLFSLEMWGGATFDTSYRFLKESPWERLATLREKIPNILFQMLIRGANAVGYKNYPDNVIREFVKESAQAGIDVFRIFDSLNWIEGMEVALDEVLKQGMVAEPCICYTGDILDETREKYNLKYYINMAKELEKRGAHILGIKDMTGLLRPMAAKKLVESLKNEIDIPIHLHTHDTSGNGGATYLMAALAGVDIVDAAFNSMAGLTSQPALNTMVAALENTERATGIQLDGIQQISNYWNAVRPVYHDFESDLKVSTAEIYKYEIPGGQYSNLRPQVESFGLGHKFEAVKDMYKTVNEMLGDIVKVTPSSKAVGDMAIFMVQNDLTPENIYEKAADIDFPDSIVSYFEGMMGQPQGGFPEKLQKLVLKDKKPITCRPGELLQPEDFEYIRKGLVEKLGLEGTPQEVISYALYPKVFVDYIQSVRKDGDFRMMGSDIFFHGLAEGETCEIKIGEGKILVIKLVEVKSPDSEGMREVVFEVNGNRHSISIKDKDLENMGVVKSSAPMADPDDPAQIGANIPGNIIKVLVKEGEKVEEKQPVAVIEAMKMETNILAAMAGTVDKVYVKEGQQVKAGELIAELSK